MGTDAECKRQLEILSVLPKRRAFNYGRTKGGASFHLILDPASCVTGSRSEAASFILPEGIPYRLAHVVSRLTGEEEEVRGYFVTTEGAYLRLPITVWEELDEEVASHLGIPVLY